MKAAICDYRRPGTLAEAIGMLGAEPDARGFLGGQSLAPMMNLRLARPTVLIDLKQLGLDSFAADDRTISIGAGHTHAAIEDGALPDMTRGLLPHVAAGIAYRGVRNRGTFGGSLAHADPAADWLTLLLLLQGAVRVSGPAGERVIAAEAFCTGAYATSMAPDEVLTACDLARLSDSARWGWCKINRKTGAFADALGAAVHDAASGLCRVVAGAVEAVPVLLPRTAAALRDAGPAAAAEVASEECDALLPQLSPDGRRLRATAVRRALAML